MATDRLNDPADFARNQRYAQQLAIAIDECRKALAEDPADYVMGSPAVRPILAKLKEAALPEAVRSINDDLDEQMAPFRATTRDPVAYDNIRDAVQHLAWFYAFQGHQPFDALRAAHNGILGVRYDFSGALRTPKGEKATVERAAAAVQVGVTPDQLGTVPGTNPGLTNERQAIYLDAIGRGFWATNASDDGAVLMQRFRDGMVLPARKGDGNLISFNFADAARIAAAARPQLPPPEPGAVP